MRGGPDPLLHEGRNQEVSGQEQSRSEQGAHTDAQHGNFLPSHERFADQGREDKSCRNTDVTQIKKGPLGKGINVHQQTKTEWGLDKTGHDTPHRVDGGSFHHRGNRCIQGTQRCLF